MSTQLQCVQKGGPFEIAKVARRSLQPDQVLIRQVFVGLNGLDWKQRDFGLFISRWPHVLGIEGAGMIEAVGSDVKHLRVGDEVTAWEVGMAHGEEWGGAYQEHVVMPAKYVARKPRNISLEQAASLPVCYIAAVCAIRCLGLDLPIPGLQEESKAAGAPESVLILGGSSSIGANAIQLLRLAYPSMLIYSTSSPHNQEKLMSLGATQVFDYHNKDLVASIQAASPRGAGVDMIIDCVAAGATQSDICDTLDPAGPKKYSSVISGVDVSVPQGVTKFDVDGMILLQLKGGEFALPALTDLIESGKYQVPLPVEIVGEGLEIIADVMDQVKTVSGTKLIVKL